MLRLDARTLIVPLHEDMHDDAILRFQQDVTTAVSTKQISGVVVDVSALDIVDSYLARILNDTAAMLKLLGAQMVLCGIQPPVALTLVEMGHELLNVPTAFNLERALTQLRTLVHGADAEALPEGDDRENDPSTH